MIIMKWKRLVISTFHNHVMASRNTWTALVFKTLYRLLLIECILKIECHSAGHYNDVIIGKMASQITSLTIVYSTVYLSADLWKHQTSAPLAFVRGIHRCHWSDLRYELTLCFHPMTVYSFLCFGHRESLAQNMQCLRISANNLDVNEVLNHSLNHSSRKTNT